MDEKKPRNRDEWSPQAIETLREMRADGKTSTAIGQVLGISRSAVAGKIRRLNLPLSPNVRPSFNPESHEALKQRRIEKAAQTLSDNPKRAVPLVKLKKHHCRAVVDLKGKNGLATFCGRKKKTGTAWCEAHHAIYIEPERHPLHGQASKRFK